MSKITEEAKVGMYTQVMGQTLDYNLALFYTHCPPICLPPLGEELAGPLSEAAVKKRRAKR